MTPEAALEHERRVKQERRDEKQRRRLDRQAETIRSRLKIAAISMVVAIVGLIGLDSMRPAPEELSETLRVKRELAVSALQVAVDTRREAAQVGLQLRREAAKAILDYAVGNEKAATGTAKNGSATEDQRLTILTEKMERLRNSETAINKMYYPSSPSVNPGPPPSTNVAVLTPAVTAPVATQTSSTDGQFLDRVILPPLAEHPPAAIGTVISNINAISPVQSTWNPLYKFADTESPLYHVFYIVMIGLVAIFAVSFLYILLHVSGIGKKGVDYAQQLAAKIPSGTAGALLAGSAIAGVAGVAGVGTAMAMSAAPGSAGHHRISSSSTEQSVANIVHKGSDFTHNDLSTRGPAPLDLPPHQVEVAATMPNVPVDLNANPSWTAATVSLADSTSKMAQLGNGLNSLGEKLGVLAANMDKLPRVDKSGEIQLLIEQSKALGAAAQQQLTNSKYADTRISRLALQVIKNDCYARRSDQDVLASTVQVDQLVAAAGAHIKSGGCAD